MCHVSTVQAKNRLLVQKYKEDKDEEEEEEEEENKKGREEEENKETMFPIRDHDFDRILVQTRVSTFMLTCIFKAKNRLLGSKIAPQKKKLVRSKDNFSIT